MYKTQSKRTINRINLLDGINCLQVMRNSNGHKNNDYFKFRAEEKMHMLSRNEKGLQRINMLNCL